jgi:S-DNA-T family DNA segregation ATPase FtsK/SpoIIIE
MYLLITLRNSIKGLFRKPRVIKKLVVFATVAFIFFTTARFFSGYAENMVQAFIIRWAWIPLTLLFLCLRHGEIFLRRKLRRFFCGMRMFGIDGSIPEYEKKCIFNKYLMRYRFKSLLHPDEWKKEKNSFEMFFKRKVFDIKQSNSEELTTMDIFVISEKLPSAVNWQNEFMESGRRFAIGESYAGRVVWDAAELPHGLVAGATGSGKTALLRCIIYQAIQKKFNVSVLDFKGGGDFSGMEREYRKYNDLEEGYGSMVISEPEKAHELLLALNIEVKGRLARFKEACVANIDEFNATQQEQLLPWLIVIDEAAEILDVKPKDKAEKDMYAEIDKSLRTLVRISRAAGCHILMGVIRPSHDVLDGQIKNNLLWRACGYFADPSVSRIALNSDKATELPPDVKGRFIIGEEETQAYYLPVPSQS